MWINSLTNLGELKQDFRVPLLIFMEAVNQWRDLANWVPRIESMIIRAAWKSCRDLQGWSFQESSPMLGWASGDTAALSQRYVNYTRMRHKHCSKLQLTEVLQGVKLWFSSKFRFCFSVMLMSTISNKEHNIKILIMCQIKYIKYLEWYMLQNIKYFDTFLYKMSTFYSCIFLVLVWVSNVVQVCVLFSRELNNNSDKRDPWVYSFRKWRLRKYFFWPYYPPALKRWYSCDLNPRFFSSYQQNLSYLSC